MYRLMLHVLFLVLVLASCGENEFGYQDNPVNVLIDLHKSIINKSQDSFSTGLTSTALCVWGTPEASSLLSANLPRDVRELDIDVKPLSEKRLERPRFTGYWSYYEAQYSFSILEKKSRLVVMEGIARCDFGVGGVKNDKDRMRDPSRYPERHCRISSIAARSFAGPTITPQCRQMIALDPL